METVKMEEIKKVQKQVEMLMDMLKNSKNLYRLEKQECDKLIDIRYDLKNIIETGRTLE